MPLALVGGVSFWKGKCAKPSRDWCSYRWHMYTIHGMMNFADDDGRMKSRCALTNIRDMVKGTGRARSLIVDSHAPSGPRQLLRRRRDPKGASSKTPPKDRRARRSFAPSERNALIGERCKRSPNALSSVGSGDHDRYAPLHSP